MERRQILWIVLAAVLVLGGMALVKASRAPTRGLRAVAVAPTSHVPHATLAPAKITVSEPTSFVPPTVVPPTAKLRKPLVSNTVAKPLEAVGMVPKQPLPPRVVKSLIIGTALAMAKDAQVICSKGDCARCLILIKALDQNAANAEIRNQVPKSCAK